MFSSRYSWAAVIAVIVSMIGAGCTARQPQAVGGSALNRPLFFPPEPDEPRVQFLRHISGSRDVKDAPGALATFLLGEDVDQPEFVAKPFGVAIHNGRIFACDTKTNEVAVFDIASRQFSKIGVKGPGRLLKPINLRIDAEGRVYVGDMLRKQVVVFDAAGEYITAYGKEGEFNPSDILLTHDELFVLDVREHCIKVYDLKTRELKRTIGKRGNQPGEFNYPTNMTMDESGSIYVSDTVNFRVQKLTQDGKPLMQFGQAGQTPGHLARPKGIAVDHNGIIYVVDALMHVVQLFNQEGQPLMHIGEAGEDAGQLGLPAQVAIDYDNVELFRQYIAPDFNAQYLIFVTNQMGKNKISVFAFGERRK